MIKTTAEALKAAGDRVIATNLRCYTAIKYDLSMHLQPLFFTAKTQPATALAYMYLLMKFSGEYIVT